MPSLTRPPGMRALGLAFALTATLAGCSLPDVSMSPGLSAPTSEAAPTTRAPEPTPATETQAAVAAPVTPVAPVRPAGDLDTGSVTHSLAAGDRSVVVDWWTEQDATTWQAADAKTVQLAAHVEGGGTRQDVVVTRFLATTDDGTTRATVADDRGEFTLTPPYSYTTALNLPPASAGASTVTLYVQLELLVETAPGSGQSFRQTVLDSISLPLAQEASA